MGVSLDTIASEWATVCRSSKALCQGISGPIADLNLSVRTKHNSSTVAFTLRVNLAFVGGTIWVKNACSCVLFINKFDAHNLDSEIRFQFLGLTSTFSNFQSFWIFYKVIIFWSMVLNFWTWRDFLIELHHCVASFFRLNDVNTTVIVWLYWTFWIWIRRIIFFTLWFLWFMNFYQLRLSNSICNFLNVKDSAHMVQNVLIFHNIGHFVFEVQNS
jgi:hypothetical protein